MKLSLVTGANGHLGNNLVRELIKQGHNVRAGIRSLDNANTLENLECEIVHCDLLNPRSLKEALSGVDTLYQVAAVFKHWAQNEEKEIVSPNVNGTIAILRAAKEAGVNKVIYVSSIVSLEHTIRNTDNEILADSWNTSNQDNPYVRSKTKSEMEALRVAKELDLNLVTVLPSTIIGGEYKPNTESLQFFSAIVNGKLPFIYNMTFNVVDASDVAKGMILASEKGIKGSRYILSNTKPLDISDIIKIAKEINPNVKTPQLLDKKTIMNLAKQAEEDAKQTNTRPALLTSNVNRTFEITYLFDIRKSVSELSYSPRPSAQVLKETFAELYR